jgi:hypothetical protein
MVDAVLLVMTCCTESKDPVPTKHWCFTAS